MIGPNLFILGGDLLRLLEYKSKFTVIQAPVSDPLSIYPGYKPEMSLEERLVLFQAQVKRYHRLDDATEAGVLCVMPNNVCSSFLSAMLSVNKQALRKGRITVQIMGSDAVDVSGVLRGTLSQVAQEIREGKCPFLEVRSFEETCF